jgi:hypothetical protein
MHPDDGGAIPTEQVSISWLRARPGVSKIAMKFSAPSEGPPPWHLYCVTVHTVVGVATAEPNGATRWRFDG